jgi:hypothetical protein
MQLFILKGKPMLNKKIVILLLVSFFFTACSSSMKVTKKNIDDDMISAMNMISSNKINYLRLGEKQIGKTGFYYIINSEGRVVFHPQLILIGKSFKGLWFIDPVLNGNSGCVNYSVSGNRNYLFYRKINNDDILCFSIMEEEITEYIQGCEEIKR